MEETISCILHGCHLTRELEANLQTLMEQPNSLSKYCEDITEIFHNATDLLRQQPQQSQSEICLRSAIRPVTEMRMGGRDIADPGTPTRFGGSAGEFQASDASNRSSNSQRLRRRNDDVETRTVRMVAPTMGNTEIPPEDGFTWRKYGQKEILGARFPRGYYRCTHQKLYQCPAKKQVQRLDDHPYIYEVKYRGDHTCHMQSTAPSSSSVPPASLEVSQATPSLLGSINLTEAAGPSTLRFPDYQMMDLDAMFNHGSSSNSSMDIIFPTLDDKCEPGNKSI